MHSDNPGPHKVGRGNPPRHSQFKPGQSGNPNGRPRKARPDKGAATEALDQKLDITVNGQKKQVTMRTVIMKSMANRAAKGDIAAAKLLFAQEQLERLRNDSRPEIAASSDPQGVMKHLDVDTLKKMRTATEAYMRAGGGGRKTDDE